MHVETKTEGCFIINSAAVCLGENEVVSYRSDAIIQEFATKEEMLAAHKLQFPEEYEGEE